MQRMGMSMDSIGDVSQVIIKTSSKDILIEQPEVAIMQMGGQKIFQIVGGTVTERAPQEESQAASQPNLLYLKKMLNWLQIKLARASRKPSEHWKNVMGI